MKLFLHLGLFFLTSHLALAGEPYIVQNKGQVKNSSLYYARGGKSNVFYSGSSITFQFYRKEEKMKPFSLESVPEGKIKGVNLELSFENALNTHNLSPENTTGAKENYFFGKDPKGWQTDLDCYSKLRYHNIYKGIDFIYYFKNHAVEYDILLDPGAKISDIKLRYKGAESFIISEAGNLQFETVLGPIKENIPESYQIVKGQKISRTVRYKISADGCIGFECSDYDKSLPLIIDPILGFSTFIGGSADENYNTDMQLDQAGNVYLCGQVTSVNMPTQAGSFDLTYNGGITDGVLMKLSATGNSLVYCTYLGTNTYDGANALHVDKLSGEVVLCGFTESSTFPTTPGAIQNAVTGQRDNYVAKVGSTGSSLVFSTLLGGPDDDRPFAITLDNFDNIYVMGYGGSFFPLSTGCFQSTYFGNYDLTIYKLNPNATTLLYGTYLGGGAYDRPGGLAVDAAHNIYISGTVDGGSGGGFPVTTGAYDVSYNGNVDIFVAKFDSTLSNLIYSTFVGGTGVDWVLGPQSLKVNAAGEAYSVGFVGNGFPTTSGAYDNSFNGGATDAVLFKMNASGNNLIFSTFMGSSGNDQSWSVELDNSGNAWCAGYAGSGFPTTTCSYDNTYNGGNSDAFISSFNNNGSQLMYSTFLGGSQNDQIFAHHLVGSTIYCAGNTGSSNFPTTMGVYDVSYNGGNTDYFITQIINSAPISITGPTLICQGQQAVLTASGASTYTWSTNVQSPTITVTPFSLTTYTVIGTDASSCTGTQTFAVNVGPAVGSPSAIAGPTLLCGVGNAQYSISPVSGATSYSWSLPGGWSGTSNSNTINVNLIPGTGIVSVFALSSCGASIPSTLAVNMNTIMMTVATTATNICVGGSATLTAVGATNYSWSTGAQAPTLTVSPTVSTVYQVTGTNGACTDTKTVNITVFALPQLSVTAMKKTICRNETATLVANGATTYTWNTTSNQPTLNVTPVVTTTYIVTGTGPGNCTNSASIVQIVSGCSGITENNVRSAITIYPNPVQTKLHLVCDDESQFHSNLHITDAAGKLILDQELSGPDTTIDVSGFAKGIYFIQVSLKGEIIATEKFLRE